MNPQNKEKEVFGKVFRVMAASISDPWVDDSTQKTLCFRRILRLLLAGTNESEEIVFGHPESREAYIGSVTNDYRRSANAHEEYETNSGKSR